MAEDNQTDAGLENIAERQYKQNLTARQKAALGTIFVGAVALLAAIHLTTPTAPASRNLDQKVRSYGWKIERSGTGEVNIYWPESDAQPLPLRMTLQNEQAYVLFAEAADIVQNKLLPEIENRHRTPYDHRLTPKEVAQIALQGDDEKLYEKDVGYITFAEARDMLERLKTGKANLKIDLEGDLKKH